MNELESLLVHFKNIHMTENYSASPIVWHVSQLQFLEAIRAMYSISSSAIAANIITAPMKKNMPVQITPITLEMPQNNSSGTMTRKKNLLAHILVHRVVALAFSRFSSLRIIGI